jgi:hypothetical protein
MPIRFTCPSCAAIVNAPDAAAGKKARCPQCKSPVDVPATSLQPAHAPAPAPAPPPPPAPAPREESAWANDELEPLEEEAPEVPAPRPTARSSALSAPAAGGDFPGSGTCGLIACAFAAMSLCLLLQGKLSSPIAFTLSGPGVVAGVFGIVFVESRTKNGWMAALIGLIAAGTAFAISGIMLLILMNSSSRFSL